MPSGKPVANIGCTSENVDLNEMNKKYKKEVYSDFVANTGTEKDLKNLIKIMSKLISDM